MREELLKVKEEDNDRENLADLYISSIKAKLAVLNEGFKTMED